MSEGREVCRANDILGYTGTVRIRNRLSANGREKGGEKEDGTELSPHGRATKRFFSFFLKEGEKSKETGGFQRGKELLGKGEESRLEFLKGQLKLIRHFGGGRKKLRFGGEKGHSRRILKGRLPLP